MSGYCLVIEVFNSYKKRVIKSRKSKDRQYIDQKKKDKQRQIMTQEIKDRAT